MNTNQIPTTKSTQELKEQVINDIKRVKEDFKEIKERMTPGQLIDDAIYYRRGGGDPAATFEFLKNNPVGTSFLTLGTLLLMEGSDHVSMEQKGLTKVKEARVKYADRVDEYKAKVGKKISDLRHRTNDYREVGDAEVPTQSKLSSAKETILNRSHDALEKAKHLDPMTYMVLGAGLGTITGAALPLTKTEERVVSGKFGKFRSELEEALNESANILKNEFVGAAADFKVKIF